MTTIYTEDCIRSLHNPKEFSMNDQQAAQLTAEIDALEAALKAQGMRHEGGIFEHLRMLKDAIVARDFQQITVAVRDLLTHFIGDEEGMRAIQVDADGKWFDRLKMLLELLKLFFAS
jgi:hypothetical protein